MTLNNRINLGKRSNQETETHVDVKRIKKVNDKAAGKPPVSDWLDWVQKTGSHLPILGRHIGKMRATRHETIRAKQTNGNEDYSNDDDEPENNPEREWQLSKAKEKAGLYVTPPVLKSVADRPKANVKWRSFPNKSPADGVEMKRATSFTDSPTEPVQEVGGARPKQNTQHAANSKENKIPKVKGAFDICKTKPFFRGKALTKIWNTANQSIRLGERDQYRELLDQHVKRDKEGLNQASHFVNKSQSNRYEKSIVPNRSRFFPELPIANPPVPQRVGKTMELFPSPWEKQVANNKNILSPTPRHRIETIENIDLDDSDDGIEFIEEVSRGQMFSKKNVVGRKTMASTSKAEHRQIRLEQQQSQSAIMSDIKLNRRSLHQHRGTTTSPLERMSMTLVNRKSNQSNISGLASESFVDDLKKALHFDCNATHKLIEQQAQRNRDLHDEREAKLFADGHKSFEDLRARVIVISSESDEDDSEDEAQFPVLTAEMEAKIDNALRPNPPGDILSRGFSLEITRKDMETLAGLNWLNDEVINFYTNMLAERGKLDNFPKCFSFNTFFYPKLMGQGHSALKRWTRKVDIFSFDLILIPVHLGMHWCLAVIDFRQKKIQYYDSMGGVNNECLNALRTYLQDESLDKKKKTFDLTDWTSETVKNIPQQMNGSDCGMFALKYAEFITRNAKITFTQQHMPYFRRRMVYEIITNKLL